MYLNTRTIPARYHGCVDRSRKNGIRSECVRLEWKKRSEVDLVDRLPDSTDLGLHD